MKRFDGLCEELCAIDVSAFVDWITAIPFEDWPQQSRLADGQIRPAMVTTKLHWHDFGLKMLDAHDGVGDALIARGHFSFGYYNDMLSVVMPGHSIEPHQDKQPFEWLARIHVPLTTNPKSVYIAEDTKPAPPEFTTFKKYKFHMEVGKAYLINTLAKHEIRNDGDTPRIHLMFDVKALG